MPADRTFLLVIDPKPETAARINGQLRNTGIEVHVLHAVAHANRPNGTTNKTQIEVIYANKNAAAAYLHYPTQQEHTLYEQPSDLQTRKW